jgi:CRP-like cAMP-binding protein
MPVLENASAASVERLLSGAVFRRYPAGQVVFDASGDAVSLFFLVDGVVRIFQKHGDQQYTPKLLLPPSHFGELSTLAGLPTYRSGAAALTDCIVGEVPVDVLEACFASDHALCRAWLYSVARQFSVTIDYLKQNVLLGVPARLANVLLTYADAFGETDGAWVEIRFDLSYAVLGRQCACTRRTAINVMKALMDEDMVRQVEDGRWTIAPERLKDELLPGRISLGYALEDNKVR